MQFETGYRSTLAAKLNAADITAEVATAPTVTAGRMHVYKGNTHAWIKYTGVTGTTLTGVTFVSQTSDPATTVTGVTFSAGTSIELVEMHDQMFNAKEGGTITGNVTVTGDISVGDDFTVTGDTVMGTSFTEPVYADATARDAAITAPVNGMSVYLTSEGYFTDYQGGVWGIRDTGTPTANASTTVAGKVELATTAEVFSGETTGGTGATLSVSPDQIVGFYSFGDGSDGDVVISVNTSLSRDMYYNDLTVNTGIELNPSGYAIYVRGTLTLSGTAKILRNGNAGTVGTAGGSGSGGGGGAGGTALATGTCGACLAGAAGGAGNSGAGTAGTAGTAVSPSYATTATASAAGGTGGTNGGIGGGAGGANATATQGTLYNVTYSLSEALMLLLSPSRALSLQASGAYGALPSSGGGGGGGGDGGSARGGGGGGGGGNGGIIFIYANSIAGTGTIEAKGGNAGNGGNGFGATATGGGGGGGGNGGIVVLFYHTGTPWTITLTAGTAGTAGTPAGSPAAANGGTGTVGQSILIQV